MVSKVINVKVFCKFRDMLLIFLVFIWGFLVNIRCGIFFIFFFFIKF